MLQVKLTFRPRCQIVNELLLACFDQCYYSALNYIYNAEKENIPVTALFRK